MACAQGDVIYASTLNSVNDTVTKAYSWSHAGWSYSTRVVYFYSTRPSGTKMLYQSNTTSTGNEKTLTLWRYENGAWVQKYKSNTASGTKTFTINSYGIGAYKFQIYDHNNTPSLTVYPSKNDCVKGNYLAMLSNDPTGLTESAAISTTRSHDKITAAALNAGRVYTL